MQVPFSTPITRSSALPASPSVSALTTGMPPATAASKRSATPVASAALGERRAVRASIALLAVTRCLPPAIAAWAVALRRAVLAAHHLDDEVDVARRASATGSSSQP